MSEHTPGPWTAADFGPEATLDGGAGRIWGVYADEAPQGERLPALCHPPHSEANARLIAAAPDLLEAAREAERLWRNGHTDYEVEQAMARLRAAVKRATEGSEQ